MTLPEKEQAAREATRRAIARANQEMPDTRTGSCECEHPHVDHHPLTGSCRRCDCPIFRRNQEAGR